jgi:hypothetical protein
MYRAGTINQVPFLFVSLLTFYKIVKAVIVEPENYCHMQDPVSSTVMENFCNQFLFFSFVKQDFFHEYIRGKFIQKKWKLSSSSFMIFSIMLC